MSEQIQPCMVMSVDLESGDINTRMYTIPKYIPEHFYNDITKWARTKMKLNKMYISISDKNGSTVVPVITKPPVNLDGIGVLEVEFRGLVGKGNFEGGNMFHSCTDDIGVKLHLSNGILPFVIDISDIIPPVEVERFIKKTVYKKLKSYGYSITKGKPSGVGCILPDCIVERL